MGSRKRSIWLEEGYGGSICRPEAASVLPFENQLWTHSRPIRSLPVAPIAGPRPGPLWSLHHFCASFTVLLAPGGGRCHSCAPGTTLTANAESWKGLAVSIPRGGPQAEIDEWD